MFGPNRLGSLWELNTRPNRPWMDIILPFYSLVIVLVHYQPQVLVPVLNDALTRRILWWGLWVVVGALGGLLALSALFLGFALVYSPVYLLGNVRRILDPQAWLDQREVRFYVWCFAIFCVLVVVALVQPEVALVSFVLLAGFAQLLWRFLI